MRELAEQFKKPVIACFGLGFKIDVDDLRESPAMDICEVLEVESNISELPERLLSKGVEFGELSTGKSKYY